MRFLKTCKCKVIMIINDNELNRFLYNGFITGNYDKMYGSTIKGCKNIQSHLIVSNCV